MSDLRENVRRAVAGDREAAAELLTPHLPALRAYLRLQASPLIRARESVADLMQSVCREILQDLAAFDATDESSLRRWLFVAA
ncbi:MAG: hypothetical protein IT457_06785, partial [Planctomycetes bacterium]|nr:hypothetical protein [Planctomycetota bacterium]